MAKKKVQNIPVFDLPGNRQFSFFNVNSEQKKHQYEPHRHNFYEIIFYRRVNGFQLIDFEEFEVQPGTWTFLSPGQVHQFHTGYMEGVILTFSAHFLLRSPEDRSFIRNNLLFHHPEYHPSFMVNADDGAVMQSILDLMEKEYNRGNCSPDILHGYLRLLLENADRAFRSTRMPVSVRDPRLLNRTRQIISLVEKNYHRHHNVTFYAEAMRLTPKRANEISKEGTGITIMSLVHRRITLEAKRMIGYSDKSIKEISFNLGFEDPAYFSRFFKKNTGESPEVFRSKCSNSTRV